MISVGMIGTDSSHTELYAGLMNPPDAPFHGQALVAKLWGEDRSQAQEKAAQCHIPQVVTEPAEVLDGVDAVMICNRYGDDHPPYARLAIQAGLPTFVDKPFANDLNGARDLAWLAAEHDVPLMSCSSVRFAPEILALQARQPSFGSLNAAVITGQAASTDIPGPRAQHPFFYGIHAVEILHTLLGPGAETVATQRTPRCDIGLVSYPDGRQGVVNLLYDTQPLHHGAVYGQQGWGQVDLGNLVEAMRETLLRFLTMAKTGQAPYPIAGALEVMAILTALVRSAESQGQPVRIGDL